MSSTTEKDSTPERVTDELLDDLDVENVSFVDEEDAWGKTTSWIVSIVLFAAVIGSIVALFAPLPRETKGIAALIMMMGLLLLKVPVGVALGISGITGIYAISGWAPMISILGAMSHSSAASWSLSVVPLFIMMGLLLWRSGATAHVYHAARVWLGWMPGSLAATTNVAGAGLGSVSGSTIGITFALAKLSIPEMLKAGYDRRLATGAVGVSGLAGQLIPPSVMLVIYAGLANTPIGVQLIAGLVPGLLLAGVFVLTIVVVATVKPSWAPKPERQHISFFTRVKISAKAIPVIVLAIVLIVGLYTGFFTATEAGAFGAFFALILMLFYRGKQAIKFIGYALVDTAITTAAIFLLIIGAGLITRLLAVTGLAQQFQGFIRGMGLDAAMLAIGLMVIFLILGMFLDTLTVMLLTVPILLPVIVDAGLSPIWFGIFVVILMEVGMVTPPVGILTFIVHKLVQDPEVSLGRRISLGDVFVGVLLFVPLALILVLVLIFFPEVVDWLPSLSSAK